MVPIASPRALTALVAGEAHLVQQVLFGAVVGVYRPGAHADPRLTVDPAQPGSIDVHITAEPVTALLMSYGRMGQLLPSLTGKIVTWGTHPWLALRPAESVPRSLTGGHKSSPS